MQIAGKSFGVWGFGVVGKSVTTFLLERSARVSIMEKRALNPEELSWCAQRSIACFQEDQLPSFWQTHDYIVPSPGIDLRRSGIDLSKIVTELDLFFLFFKKPIIAITGTVGKTSTTHFIATTLAAIGLKVVTGGNIGIGMLDLVAQAEAADYAVLEVSSFQLEYCRHFAPEIAVWTNLYPNHLDRHGTFDRYLEAKLQIIARQGKEHQAVLHADLLDHPRIAAVMQEYQGTVLFFGGTTSTPIRQPHICIENNMITYHEEKTAHALAHESSLPRESFTDNWLAVIAILNLLQLPLPDFQAIDYHSPFLQHRLEKIETRQSVTFYDDSKATVPESTLAAVHLLQSQPLILLLGGLSKGIKRDTLIAQLPNSLKKVVCFGAEAEQLAAWCTNRNLPAIACSTLEDALKHCMTIADQHSPVLFSPAGSSFDLFTDYRHRGRRFKELVAQYYEVI